MKAALVKVGFHGTSCFGSLPLGHRVEVKVPDGSSIQIASDRALRMLKRSNPDENPMEWQVELPEATA